MATAVFFSFPGHGHVIPSLPIIAELVRRGEHIIYYATIPFRKAVEQTGAAFRTYGAEFPLAAPATLKRFARGTRFAIPIQLETSEWVLTHLLPEIQTLHPDYVLYDSLSSWGPYVSQILAKPSISFFPTFVYNYRGVTSEPLRRRLRDLLRRAWQFPVRLHANRLSRLYQIARLEQLSQLMQSEGALNLVLTSHALQPDADAFDPARFKFIGPAITPRVDAPPFPFERLDARPIILISLGTAFNDQPAFYQSCLDAFRGMPWQVVMATGDNFSPLPQDIPENVIVCPMIPQLELLERTAVFITHGGMNSVNEALYYNVPLILVAQGANHGWITGRVRALGAGIGLDKRRVNAPQLRQAVETILHDPAYTLSAKRIGATLRATGGFVTAADDIFEFTRAHRSE